ncbi:MAG: hypothetical protein QOD06_291 [Candidatus Binatota bacterium]|jgi:plastocyanin|nr:hypothetical protein [Candidatus Binatota bacterium]
MRSHVLSGGIAVLAFAAVAGLAVAADTGTIVGQVSFEGTPPAPKKIEVTKDQQVCGKEKEAESLIVGSDGGIKNAVVHLTGVSGGAKPEAKTVTFDQKQCHYVPHVLMFPEGSTVKILNSDGILHNIHTYSQKNPSFNKAQPKFKKEIEASFKEPENIKVTCDAHGWMSGVFVVQDSPYYALTGDDGKFKIENVPAGEQTIKVWHEELGEKEQKVKVEAGKEAEVAFKLSK